MEVFNLDGGIDHRTALLEVSDVYYHPVDESTHTDIERRLEEISITPLERNTTITILGRDIPTIAHSEDVAWFEFDVICNAPRAAQDYIQLAQRYNTIAVSNIPVLVEQDDMARRFIYLIDELYDRNVKLIASALDVPQNLYRGTMLEFAFNRTSSRLIEMRSHKYLSSSHRPFKDEQVTD
jgi:cell division protein ZapE